VLCDADRVPAVVLDRVMRQKAETGIPAVAEAVRYGREPDLAPFEGTAPGVSFIECTPEEAIDVISGIGRQLRAGGAALGDTQIIAPVRSGSAGIDAMNRAFHRARHQATGGDFFPGRTDIAGGDPIIWTRNDWDRELMNGSMGRLHSVIDGIGHATLDGKPHELTEVDAEMIELAYAISVHKAQGSQWPRVIVPIFPSRLLDRTLLYTAITRATEQVVLVGNAKALAAAIKDAPRALLRSVGLGERLRVSLM
jgi:exodeoxyribonuclease V alpha subunit